MAKNFSDVILQPLITEKSTALAAHSKYTFKVANDASKDSIKIAFKKLYPEFKVLKVQTLKVRGHAKRTKKGIKPPVDSKKAILTIEGGKIEYFPEAS